MKTAKLASVILLSALFLCGMAFAQTDPGVQGGNRGTGAALASVTADANQNAFFQDGLTRFQDVERVSDPSNQAVGLGPRFNFLSCSGCHSQPAIGGTGPANNPQFPIAGSSQAPRDTRPAFITANGPTREARFPFFFDANGNPNPNNPNGGVEDLFTVSGRADAGNCNIAQPSFAQAAATGNLIFRIPTPVFGAGLVENLDDSTLLANTNNNNVNNVGINGTHNHNGNDGTITRFGWKAQNKSLHIFAGEAYNVEMGISNLLFTQDRPLPGEDGNGGSGLTGLPHSATNNCLNLAHIGYPEDTSNPGSAGAAILDDVSAFANFMRDLAPPPTGGVVGATAASIANGRSLFSQVGCGICHNPTVGNTQQSNITANLSNAPVHAFSDFAIHHMGTTLADNVGQGGAGGDQFRTAPLWGLGQRIFLLHDGRCTTTLCAIEAHESQGGEATTVENIFDVNLSPSQQQDVLNFLRSL
jgi:CxxC motif-containing protein (DUF1111 family)